MSESNIIDFRPGTLLQAIAPSQKKFALILFDLEPGTNSPETDDLTCEINRIFNATDIQVWLSDKQLIVLSNCGKESSKLNDAVKSIEQAFKCKAGVVFYPEDGRSLQVLAQKAYQATRLALNIGLRQSIEKALANNEFFLVYQPQINTSTGEYIGVEALIRWQSKKEQRIIMPLEFLPMTEAEGMMDQICKWTLYEACRQNIVWQGEGKRVRTAVNISTTYLLNKSFMKDLDQVLIESGINPKFLELEITENNIISKENLTRVNTIIQSVRDRGIIVSLDDFGMEYNTFELLRVLSLDRIKIDKVFVQNIETKKGALIIQATIGLARAMGLECIAEGVETRTQGALLEKMGCFNMQGYLIGRPKKSFPEWQKVAAL